MRVHAYSLHAYFPRILPSRTDSPRPPMLGTPRQRESEPAQENSPDNQQRALGSRKLAFPQNSLRARHLPRPGRTPVSRRGCTPHPINPATRTVSVDNAVAEVHGVSAFGLPRDNERQILVCPAISGGGTARGHRDSACWRPGVRERQGPATSPAEAMSPCKECSNALTRHTYAVPSTGDFTARSRASVREVGSLRGC